MGTRLQLAIQLCLYLPLASPACPSLAKHNPSSTLAFFTGPQTSRITPSFRLFPTNYYLTEIRRRLSLFPVGASLRRQPRELSSSRQTNMPMRGGGEGDVGDGASSRIKVVVISGPTAVGKSALAERLAQVRASLLSMLTSLLLRVAMASTIR